MRHSGASPVLHHYRVLAWDHIGRVHTGPIGRLLRNTTDRHPPILLALLRVIHHLLLLCGGIVDVTWLLLLRRRRRIRTWRKGILWCVHGLSRRGVGRGGTRERGGEGYEEGPRSMSGYGYATLWMLAVRMRSWSSTVYRVMRRDLRRFESLNACLNQEGKARRLGEVGIREGDDDTGFSCDGRMRSWNSRAVSGRANYRRRIEWTTAGPTLLIQDNLFVSGGVCDRLHRYARHLERDLGGSWPANVSPEDEVSYASTVASLSLIPMTMTRSHGNRLSSTTQVQFLGTFVCRHTDSLVPFRLAPKGYTLCIQGDIRDIKGCSR